MKSFTALDNILVESCSVDLVLCIYQSEIKSKIMPERWRAHKKEIVSYLFLRSSYGNRTHDSAVRGQRLNPLTNEPFIKFA